MGELESARYRQYLIVIMREEGKGGDAQVKDRREHRLNNANDQPSMNDKLGEFGRALVRVATVPEEEFGQVRKLVDREVGGERGLTTFFADDTDACAFPRRVSTKSRSPFWYGAKVQWKEGAEKEKDAPTSAA